jgi:uncharacterized protein (TIGR02117 family)
MDPMRTRNNLRRLAVAAAWLGLALYGYAAAGLIGGAIPSNADWRQPHDGVRVFVESNGVHVSIVMPKLAAGPGWRVDWRPLVPAAHLRDPRYGGYDHVAFGWGDADFYLNTPTWRDVRLGTVLAAAAGSERTVMHVAHGPAPAIGKDVRAIVLTADQYRRLADHIRTHFAARPAHQTGYGVNDVFYAADGRYSALRTCNAWAGDALRHAGVRVGAWTPFPATILWWF